MTYKILRTNSQANKIEILEKRVSALEDVARPAAASLPPGVDFHLSVAPCSADNLTDDEVLHLAYQSEDPLVRRLAEIADPGPSEEESRTLSELWDLLEAVEAVQNGLRKAFYGVSTDD